MSVAALLISRRSRAKAALALVAKKLPDPRKKYTAVCISVYSEFMPNRQGVTIVLLMMD